MVTVTLAGSFGVYRKTCTPPMRNILLYTLFCVTVVTGCSSLRYQSKPENYRGDRNGDYPVQIAWYSGDSIIDSSISSAKVLPVTVVSRTSSKTDGAAKGAGRGALECGIASIGAGSFAPFIFLPCAVILMPTMAVVGAVIAHPEAEINQMQKVSKQGDRLDIRNILIEQAETYFNTMTVLPISVRTELQSSQVKLSSQSDNSQGTIAELSIRKISLIDVGEKEAPFCLLMTASGRKVDKATGKMIRELWYSQAIECLSVEDWIRDDGENLRKAIVSGTRYLSERLIDELYLIYYPQTNISEDSAKQRPVPAFILAPISPPAPEMYLDLRTITRQPKHIQGLGGMHFVDIDNLSPILNWEIFPRSFDMDSDTFSDISYEIRIFSSRPGMLRTVEPASLIEEAKDLIEPQYAVQTLLQPCSRYFWTIRANFTLDGIRRVTEWGGAYITAGGEVAPSRYFYYPFRTPSIDASNKCWS
jgi:hypothetical protein